MAVNNNKRALYIFLISFFLLIILNHFYKNIYS